MLRIPQRPWMICAAFFAFAVPAFADLSLSPNTANASANGAINSVQIIATDQSVTWTASSNQSWFTITSAPSGKGNGNVNYAVAANPAATSRVANLTFTASSGNSPVLVVTQLGGILSISPSSANVDVSGGSGSIAVYTEDASLQWTVTSNEAWVRITSGATGIGAQLIQWTASGNQGSNSRTAVITVTPLSGVGQTFPVSQPAGNGGTISLSPSGISLDATARNGSLQVIATNQSLAWSAASNQSWFTISGTSGSGNGTISYSASANPSAASRTATVTVTPKGAPVVTVSATQSGGVLVVSPSSANVAAAGGSGSVSLTTNDGALPWTAGSNQGWLVITSGASGTGSGTVQWSAGANSSNAARSATISITPSGGVSQTFNVNQEAGQITGTISLSPGSVNAPASVSNGTVQVISTNPSLAWTAVSSDISWLTITSGASGTGNGSFSYLATGNPTAASRNATITVTPANGTAAILSVTQIAGVLTVSPSSANVQGSGGTGSLTIGTNNTTLNWSAASDSPWLTITSPASGIADAMMTWAVAANSTTTARTGTITITPLGGSPLTFTVTEGGLSGTINTSPSALSFSYQQFGTTPAAAQVSVGNGVAGIPFTTSASSTGSWLAVSAGSTTPSVINVSVNPVGLSAGTYSGTVTLTSPAATNSPVIIPVTLTITPAPVLISQPNSISFSYQQNGAVPSGRAIALTSSSGSLDYSIVQDPSAPWLSATGSGPAPSTLTLNVNPAGLQPGSYQGAVSLLASAAGNNPLSLPVSLMVSAAPSLIGSPASLSVTYRQLDPLPAPIDFAVTSSGETLFFGVSISPSTPWLNLGPIVPTQGLNPTPSSVHLNVDPTGLAPGTYQGEAIAVSSGAGNNPLTVPVTLTVIPAAMLSAAPSQVSFGITQGGSTTASQSILITSDSPANLTVTASTTSGNWLSAEAGASGTPASLIVTVQAAALSPGTYMGTIAVTSAQAGNSPLSIPVVLTVSPLPQLTVNLSQLTFPYQLLSGSLPPQQALTVSAGSGNVPVTITISTSSGGSWLSTTGGISTPGVIQIGADPDGLSAGSYFGSIVLSSPGYAQVTIPVALRIVSAPVLAAHPGSLEFASQTGGAAPQAQTIVLNTSSTKIPFSASTSGAPWLSVTGGGTAEGESGTPVSVSVNPARLSPGSYTGSVILESANAGNNPLVIPVHLSVTAGLITTALPSSLNFTYTQQGNLPGAQSLSVSIANPARSLQDFTTSVSPAQSWLNVSGAGPAPASLQVSVDPTGLTPGTYNVSIVIAAPATANSPLIVPVSLTVKAAPTISLSESQLAFSYQLLGDAPANQTLTVTGSDPSLVVTATASTESGIWLTVIGGGNLPASFSVSANPSGLAAGTYNGTVTLSSPGAGNSPLEFPVTLIVSPAPVLRSAPDALTFSYNVGDPSPAATTVQVSSSGVQLTYQVVGATAKGGNWLNVSAGDTTNGAFSVAVNPIGLAPGTYTGTISVTATGAGNNPLLVPVTLTVSTISALTAAPGAINLVAQQGVGLTTPQLVHISASPGTFAVTYQKSPGADWLSFDGPSLVPGDLNISASATNLAPGRYTAVILVISQFAANSPLSIPVTFDVSAVPVLSASPSNLRYSYTVSGTKPPPQTFSMLSSGGPLDFSATVLGATPWLFASVVGTTPGSVSVSVDPGALAAGTYTGTIVISSSTPGTNQITVPVILTVSNAPLLSVQPLSQSFSYQLGGPIPTGRALVVTTSDNSIVPVSISASTVDSGDWLSVTVNQRSTPATALISVNPVNLTAGSYSGQIRFLSPGAGNSPLMIPVTLRVSHAPALNPSQSRLLFSYQVGGTPPANQQITLSASDGSALPLSAVVSNSFSAISASVDSSTTPAVLTVAVSPGNLSPGIYQSSVVVSSGSAGNSPLVIPVVLTISLRPALTSNPSAVTFAYGIGGVSPASTFVTAGSTGDPLDFSVSSVGSTWLTATGGGTTPSPVRISVNPAGLSPGVYNSVVVLTSAAAGNNPLQIVVTLTVSSSPLLAAFPTSLTFSEASPTLRGSGTVAISSVPSGVAFTTSVSSSTSWLSVTGGGVTPQNISISANATGLSPGTYQGSVQVSAVSALNSPLIIPVTLIVTPAASLQATPSPLSFLYKVAGSLPAPQSVNLALGGQSATTATAAVFPGSPWLSTTSAGSTVNVTANPIGLLPGIYSGTIGVSSPDAANSPLAIPVSLTVAGGPEFDVSQDGVAFTVLQPQSAPVSNAITLTTGNNPPVNFTLDVTASTWFTVTPLTGTTPAIITITADPTGLRPGNYSGSVAFYSSGKKLRTLGVNLTISSIPTVNSSPPFLVFNYSRGGNAPAPSNLWIGRFDAALSVTATPSDPWITVDPSGPSTSGPVKIAINPAGLGPGVYQGTIALAITNALPGGTPPAKQIPVSLYVDQPANPQVSSVVSSAHLLSSGLSPGLIFTIFGNGLGPDTPVGLVVQPDQTLSQSLAGVEVLVNGIPCPLVYVSSTQINAIAPYALYKKDSATVAVRYKGVVSDEIPVSVLPSVPGLYSSSAMGSGNGAILNQDQSVNSPTNPSAKNSIISLFGTGDGQSVPHGIDGLLAPTDSTQLTHPLLPVSVMIGGLPATDITYMGGAPTLTAGMIQVNVRIPASVPSGNVPVLLTIGNAVSQTGLFVSVK